jgi:hypothetical protein
MAHNSVIEGSLMKVCIVEGCEKKQHVKIGYCSTHYARFKTNGHIELSPPKIIAGDVFNNLTAIEILKTNDTRHTHWLCHCKCGRTKSFRMDVLRNGSAIDCGCGLHERLSLACTEHGYTRNGKKNGNSTYVSWKCMKQRCDDPNKRNYRHYGGAGVKVCDRWRDFSKFVEDMGERPEGKTIDRIDPYGDYEPNNCRWADWHTQNTNKRINEETERLRHYRKRKFLTVNRVTKSYAEWAELLGITKGSFGRRLANGWTPERAVTEPRGVTGPKPH